MAKCICQIHIMQRQKRIYGHWIELKLICCSGKQRLHVARCLLPVALHRFLLMFQCSCRCLWRKKVCYAFGGLTSEPRGKLATAICELVVSCQLIMFMCDGETTASSVRQTEAETERGRESVRQRWIKRGKLQTARKETNRMSHVDLNNWSLTWIIATPREQRARAGAS